MRDHNVVDELVLRGPGHDEALDLCGSRGTIADEMMNEVYRARSRAGYRKEFKSHFRSPSLYDVQAATSKNDASRVIPAMSGGGINRQIIEDAEGELEESLTKRPPFFTSVGKHSRAEGQQLIEYMDSRTREKSMIVVRAMSLFTTLPSHSLALCSLTIHSSYTPTQTHCIDDRQCPYFEINNIMCVCVCRCS